jgi:hypothetical protein
MKEPANLPADRLIMEYLARVTDAATRYLPKGGRIAFVSRTRARIERACGQAGLGDPGRVREILAGLGEPEALVKQERARLDAAWVKKRTKDKQAAEAAAASITEPRQYRRINSRWKPATDTQPLPLPPRPGQPGAQRGGRAGGAGGAREGKRRGWLRGGRGGGAADGPADEAPGSQETRPWESTGAGAPDEAEPPVLEGTVIQPSAGPVADAPPGTGREQPPGAGYQQPPGTDHQQPPGPLRPSAHQPANLATPPAVPSRQARGTVMLRGSATALAHGAGRWAKDAGTLSRRHPLEAVAILLLGVGGLIFPFPFWLLGGALAVFSRFWQPRDKWVALVGPILIALAGTMVTALIVGGQGNPVMIYSHALRMDVGYLLRAGSVLCAGYLAWQVRRGRRVRLPPWRR